jgi:cyclopropane fatty-acyl-phospholipid synthase-like methyltransferase
MKNLEIKPNATIVDLGCGDGKALRFFSTEHKIKL